MTSSDTEKTVNPNEDDSENSFHTAGLAERIYWWKSGYSCFIISSTWDVRVSRRNVFGLALVLRSLAVRGDENAFALLVRALVDKQLEKGEDA